MVRDQFQALFSLIGVGLKSGIPVVVCFGARTDGRLRVAVEQARSCSAIHLLAWMRFIRGQHEVDTATGGFVDQRRAALAASAAMMVRRSLKGSRRAPIHAVTSSRNLCAGSSAVILAF